MKDTVSLLDPAANSHPTHPQMNIHTSWPWEKWRSANSAGSCASEQKLTCSEAACGIDGDGVLSSAVRGSRAPPLHALDLPLDVTLTPPFSFPGLSEPVCSGRARSRAGLVLRTLPIPFPRHESVWWYTYKTLRRSLRGRLQILLLG